MIGISIVMAGATKLVAALGSKDTIGKPVGDGIRKIALYYDGLVKKATVVDTNRLRSSITNQINPPNATIGTNVGYARFVEYGTANMEARHMEGGTKVLGTGMFAHAMGLLHSWLDKDNHNIHKDIDKEFK